MNSRSLTLAARAGLLVAVVAISWLATTSRAIPVVEDVPDKVNHVSAFLALSALVDFSFRGTRFGLAKAGALLAYGLLIEVVQYFLPYRDFSLFDLAADGVGIALYAFGFPLLARLPGLAKLGELRGLP